MAQKINLRGLKMVIHAAGWTQFCKALDMANDVAIPSAVIVLVDQPVSSESAERLIAALNQHGATARKNQK